MNIKTKEMGGVEYFLLGSLLTNIGIKSGGRLYKLIGSIAPFEKGISKIGDKWHINMDGILSLIENLPSGSSYQAPLIEFYNKNLREKSPRFSVNTNKNDFKISLILVRWMDGVEKVLLSCHSDNATNIINIVHKVVMEIAMQIAKYPGGLLNREANLISVKHHLHCQKTGNDIFDTNREIILKNLISLIEETSPEGIFPAEVFSRVIDNIPQI